MIVALNLPNGLMLGSIALHGNRNPARIESGYALTQGVPKEDWEAWFAANRKGALVTNHLIFAAETEKEVMDWIAQHPFTRSGMEGAGRGF